MVPKPKRAQIVLYAHNHMGHFSVKKTLALVRRNFTWPNLARDVKSFVEGCVTCQKYNQGGGNKVPMVERPIITIPFEVMALDIVGPLPKAKGGVRHLLTAMCMSSRWPDARPLHTIMAEAVAEACMEIFSYTGLPRVILTDQGSQFNSALAKQMCTILNIEHIRTTPYRPQSNGVIERFHRTLKGIVTKASDQKLNWIPIIPLALSFIRQAPNRSLGFSPDELVHGRHLRSPLDLLYCGWRDLSLRKINVCQWVETLGARLELLHDVAALNSAEESAKRKVYYDCSATERSFSEGDKVLYRIPGRPHKPSDSWEGPYIVIERKGPVNYKIKRPNCQARGRVVHINTLKSFKESAFPVCAISVIANDQDITPTGTRLSDTPCADFSQKQLQALIQEFPTVFTDSPGVSNVAPARISIPPDTPVISQAPYRLPEQVKSNIQSEIQALLDSDIIECSDSLWCSPLLPVKKHDGSVRLCVDFRKNNALTPQLQTYLPCLDDILLKVGSSTVLSTIDLAKGFHQIVLEPSSRQYTTFSCPFGRFQYKRLPFGLKNAPAFFQETMTKVLAGCSHYSDVYIDDIIVFSNSWSERLVHLRSIFAALAQAGLTIKVRKCQFGKTSLNYLGHQVGSGKLALSEARVADLAEYKRPKSKKDLKSFLGLVSYYRHFIPNLADKTALLSPGTSSKAPDSVRWTPERLEAFNHLRLSLCNYCILVIPNVNDRFQLHTDASGVGVGAVLHVIRNCSIYPVAFFS